MEYRILGRTGLRVSALGFGCGAVGGVLVRGERAEMLRVVSRAIELGVNYYDTARIYADGLSETNLGWVLEELHADVLVGTKVRLTAQDAGQIERAVFDSVEGSLKRLRRERVDLIQLHNSVSLESRPDSDWLTVDQVAEALAAFDKLQAQGKARFWGINGLGEAEALHQAVALGRADTIQCCYNLINPSAGAPAPAGFPFQDYDQLIARAAQQRMGVIAIRVLAGGALSGAATRHPNATAEVQPIASGRDFAADVAYAARFRFLVDEGYASSLVEAAIRFVLSNPNVSTALVGISDGDQLEQAVAAATHGPLPAEALARLAG